MALSEWSMSDPSGRLDSTSITALTSANVISFLRCGLVAAFHRKASSFARLLLISAIANLGAADMCAQMPANSSTTSTPIPGAGHDYLGEIGETVDPATGSTSIRINAMMPPGRGLTLPFAFAYDSNGVDYVSTDPNGNLYWATPSTTVTSEGGWSNTVPVLSVVETSWTTRDHNDREIGCAGVVNFVYQDAHGDRHDLNLTTYTGAGNSQSACTYGAGPPGFKAQWVTNGGEGAPGAIIASIPSGDFCCSNFGPVTVEDADGTVGMFSGSDAQNQCFNVNSVFCVLATSIEDRNGNVVTINPPVYPAKAYSYLDTAGRTALQDTGFAVSPETVTVSGLSGSYTLTWTTLSTPTFTAPVTTIKGTCNFGGNHSSWGSQVGVHTLSLPNGKVFSFSYDPTYGLVNKMTYPNGGYIRYVWGINSQAEFGASQGQTQCDALYGVPVITDRYVSFTGATEELHQQFTYSTTWNINYGTGSATWTSKQTTVTTTDNVRNTSFNTVYTYSPSTVLPPPNMGSAPTGWIPVESSIAYSDTNSTLLKTVTKTWVPANPRLLTSQTTTYPNGQADETTWNYNGREQVIEQDDYDFGSSGVGSLIRKIVTNYQQFNLSLYTNAPTIADRPCQVITYDSSGTNRVAETDYFYDNGATTTPCGTAGTPSVSGAGGSSLTGHDETNYSTSSTTPRGNLTQQTRWLNTGASPITTYSYDETGQLTSLTDPNLNQTSYSYADSFLSTNSGGFTTTGGAPPSGTVTNAYLTKVTQPSPNGVAEVESYSYGYNDGSVTQSTDQNSQLTTYRFNDSLGRLTETDYPDTGQTTISYNDSVPSVTTTKLITSSTTLVTTTLMDGLNHTVQTQLTSDPDQTTYTSTAYDGLGRVYQTWNPYRSTSDSTYGITTFTYDALGRITTTSEPDGSVVSTSYNGNQTTVTDETGNQRTSQNDGLGRLTYVWEAPNNSGYNYLTSYVYDALNDLTSVTQNGSNSSNARVRTFTYDSLARLTSSTNPESGTITYSYDANGNVVSKVAPKPNQTGTARVTTNYTYDSLNRLTQKAYVNLSTQPANYGYDGTALTGCNVAPPSVTSPTNLVGRRSAMCSSVSASSFSYDPMGRVLFEARKNKGSSAATYTVGSTYYQDGSLKTLTYPSNDVVTYVVGGAGRTTQLSDASNNYVGYAGVPATYAPNGALATMVNGYTSSFPGIVTSDIYNNRLQPILLSASVSSTALMSLCYDFHLHQAINVNNGQCSFPLYTTGNNGNVFQVLNNVDSTRNTAFQYDPLNRISQANTIATTGANCWGEVYTIDAWGNLTNRAGVAGMGGCMTESLNAAPASTKNQLTGIVYDAAGNVTNDGAGNQPSYDAENRIATDSGITYNYDADGFRMEKSSGTMYWSGAGGEVLAESDLTGNINEEYIYFNGQRLARVDRPSGAVHYYFSDHLGSASMIVNASGNVEQQYYYYPYGGLVASIGADPNHYKFTGKERDAESGLDNFGARYNASSMGRFMTPDGPLIYASKDDPQTWNLYSYVRNNPLNRVDPNGHLTIIVPGTGYSASDWNMNMKLVNEAKERFHDSDVRILNWSGKLGSNAISEGGQMLRDIVASHDFAPNEQLNVITHSRGGEVALDASLGIEHPIDNLITLAPTDWSQDYNLENILNWENISVAQDWVVSAASNQDPKHYPHANNLVLNAPNYGHISAHSAIWQNDSLRNLWWNFWQQHAQCHEWFDDKTNTVHGCI